MHGFGSPPPERALAQLAARQWGVLSRAQLLAIGLGADAIEWRARSGRLHRVHHGVYAVGHTALRREGRFLAAVLACGPGAVLSHRSAAALAQATAREPKLTRSDWEVRLLGLVRTAGLPEALVNHALIAPDYGHCEADFFWPAHNLIAETVSWSAHGNATILRRLHALLQN